jgi:hypothetical protein
VEAVASRRRFVHAGLTVSDDTLIVRIDEAGHVTVEGQAAQRRLAGRPGRYRLVPSASNLVILERVDEPGDARSGSTDRGSGRMLLSGEVGAVGGLVDVLHLVHSSRWSGQFAVLDGALRKTVYFREGDVVAAASTAAEDRLGAILYRYGMVSAQQLERVLERMAPGERLGQHLVDRGVLTPHTLYQYVRRQIEEIFQSVLALRRGEYYFFLSEEVGPASQLRFSTASLLLEGVRRMDEMSYFREKIPSSRMVPMPAADRREGEALPPRSAGVLALVDGRRDVAAIGRESHLGEFEATRHLFHLLRGGHVDLRDPQAPVQVAVPLAGPDAALRRTVERFNQAYAQVTAAVAAQGADKRAALARGLESFFVSAGGFAPLFVGVEVRGDGTLPVDALVGNLELAPIGDKPEYLYRGLNELLSFLLFNAGELADRGALGALGERLRAALARRPEPATDG